MTPPTKREATNHKHPFGQVLVRSPECDESCPTPVKVEWERHLDDFSEVIGQWARDLPIESPRPKLNELRAAVQRALDEREAATWRKAAREHGFHAGELECGGCMKEAAEVEARARKS